LVWLDESNVSDTGATSRPCVPPDEVANRAAVNLSSALEAVRVVKTIVLISCSSRKLPYRARAEDLYASPLFRLNLRYARSLDPDAIFVLSAKHGLVDLENNLEPYDLTLNEMPAEKVKEWAGQVLARLRSVADLGSDRVVFLAGERYRKYLLPHVSHPEIPLRGLGIGKQMQFLKERTRYPKESTKLSRKRAVVADDSSPCLSV
jgi:hypothetical protein